MEIVLHLGAHKTATTYLQVLLERNVVALEQHNIGLAHPKTLRPMFAVAPRRNFPSERAHRISSRTWALNQVIDTAVDLQRRRLVISEEQLIGSLRALMSGRGLYRDVQKELRAVTGALQDHPVRVMMCIRSYDSFFVSAYGQVLNGWKYLPFDARLRERLIQDNRGWPEIIADIMQALPKGSTLNLWRFEDFPVLRNKILAAMIGGDAAESLQGYMAQPVPGPSAAAIETLQAHVADHGKIENEQIRQILRRLGKDKGFPAYQPWLRSETDAFRERYEHDVSLIRQLWPGALIEHGDDPQPTCVGTQTVLSSQERPLVHAVGPALEATRSMFKSAVRPGDPAGTGDSQSGVSMYPAPRTV